MSVSVVYSYYYPYAKQAQDQTEKRSNDSAVDQGATARKSRLVRIMDKKKRKG